MAVGDRLPQYDIDTPSTEILDFTFQQNDLYVLTKDNLLRHPIQLEIIEKEVQTTPIKPNFLARNITSDERYVFIGYSRTVRVNNIPITTNYIERIPSDENQRSPENIKFWTLSVSPGKWSANSTLITRSMTSLTTHNDHRYLLLTGGYRITGRGSTTQVNALFSKSDGTLYRKGIDLGELISSPSSWTLDGDIAVAASVQETRGFTIRHINWFQYDDVNGVHGNVRVDGDVIGLSSADPSDSSILSFVGAVPKNQAPIASINGVSWLAAPTGDGTYKLVAFQSQPTGTPDDPIPKPKPPRPPRVVVNRFDRVPQFDITYNDLGDQRNLVNDITITEGLAWILTTTNLYRRALDNNPLAAKVFLLTQNIGTARRITRDARHLYIGYTQYNNSLAQTNRIEQRLISNPDSVVNTWTVAISATQQWATIAPTLVPLEYHGIASEQKTSTGKVWVSCFTYANTRTSNADIQEIVNVAIQKTDGAQDTSIPPAILNAAWYPSLGHDIDDDVYYFIYYRSDGHGIVYNDFTDNIGAAPITKWNLASATHPGNTGVPSLTAKSIGFATWNGYGWYAETTATEVKLISFLLRNEQPGLPGPVISPITPSPFQPPPANLRWSTGAVDSKFN